MKNTGYAPSAWNDLEILFKPIDRLNPSIGYHLRITDADTGTTLLSTTDHPVTGKTLKLDDVTEVIGYYIKPPTL